MPKFGDRGIMNPPEAILHFAKVMKYSVEIASIYTVREHHAFTETSPTVLKPTVLALREFSSQSWMKIRCIAPPHILTCVVVNASKKTSHAYVTC